jgi:ABC-type dipeptide/oligopeptide/nickel transport system permease component
VITYLRREAVALLVLLLVASFIIFSIVYIAPGDPLAAAVSRPCWSTVMFALV